MSDRPRAFTLIELLVVISIISLLIAILLPALSRARVSAQAVQSTINARQIMFALHLYADDSKGFLPLARGGGNFDRWTNALLKPGYLSSNTVLWSPGRARYSQNLQYTGYGANTRGGMPWDNGQASGTFATGAHWNLNLNGSTPQPKLEKLALLTEVFHITHFVAGNHDGYWDAWPSDTIAAFTYDGRLVRAYADGHATSGPSLELGWRATNARSGEWVTTHYSTGVLSTNLIGEPWYDQRANTW